MFITTTTTTTTTSSGLPANRMACQQIRGWKACVAESYPHWTFSTLIVSDTCTRYTCMHG